MTLKKLNHLVRDVNNSLTDGNGYDDDDAAETKMNGGWNEWKKSNVGWFVGSHTQKKENKYYLHFLIGRGAIQPSSST